MKYDKKKHLDLLKYSQTLEKQGKSIYDESKDDFFKLRKYSALMIANLHWQNREQYFELIEEFLNQPIHFLGLRQRYQSINDSVECLEAELILLEPIEEYQKAFEFILLIDEIVLLFDQYCLDAGSSFTLGAFRVGNFEAGVVIPVGFSVNSIGAFGGLA